MRSISAAAALTAVLLSPLPSEAQTDDPFWDPARPDALAPAAVFGDAMVEPGELVVSYRFVHADMGRLRFEGEIEGVDPQLTVEDAIQFFSVVPLTRSRDLHELQVTYGAAPWATLLVRVPYIYNDAEQVAVVQENGQDVIQTFSTSSDGFADPSASILFRLWNQGNIRSHVQAGLSFPIGDIDATDLSPLPAPTEAVLPFPMQLGSGTFEFLPGITLTAMNDVGVFGAQVLATIRLGENNLGFSFGNQMMATAWMTPRVSDYLSVSLRLVSNWWENVQLKELDLTDPLDPRLFDISAVPFFQGGMRWDVPVGVNVYFPERSMLHGLRLSGEAIFPVHHEVEGIQLGMDWGAAFTARWTFGEVVSQGN